MEMAVEIADAREDRTSGLLGCSADSLRVKSACGARPLCRPRGRIIVLPQDWRLFNSGHLTIIVCAGARGAT
jgi:hypothetical protein